MKTAEEKISEEIAETRKYFFEEIRQKKLISKKHKKLCKALNYIEQLLILASTIFGCDSISAFTSLIVIPIGIASSAVEIKTCAINAVIKKYESRKKNTIQNNIVSKN